MKLKKEEVCDEKLPEHDALGTVDQLCNGQIKISQRRFEHKDVAEIFFLHGSRPPELDHDITLNKVMHS